MVSPPLASPFSLFRQGIVACIPIMLGYWAVSFACSAVGIAQGFSFWQLAALSIFLYAGSAQFLLYSLVASGTGVVEIAIAVAFINMRYVLTNTYLTQYLRSWPVWQRIIGAILITDETFAVSVPSIRKEPQNFSFYWLLGLNLAGWINWILAGLAGSIFAFFMPIWLRNSLSFSLVGMFVGLLIIGLQNSPHRRIDLAVIFGAAVADFLLFTLFNQHIALIAAASLAAGIGLFLTHQKTWKVEND